MHRTPIEQPEDLRRKSCLVWRFHKSRKESRMSVTTCFLRWNPHSRYLELHCSTCRIVGPLENHTLRGDPSAGIEG